MFNLSEDIMQKISETVNLDVVLLKKEESTIIRYTCDECSGCLGCEGCSLTK